MVSSRARTGGSAWGLPGFFPKNQNKPSIEDGKNGGKRGGSSDEGP